MDETRRKYDVVVSHGINIDTDEIVILPNTSPESIGAVWDHEMHEFVLGK